MSVQVEGHEPIVWLGKDCSVCWRQRCASTWLYVAIDDRDGSVKIGASQNVTKRIGKYRANGNPFFRLFYKKYAGCESMALVRERNALAALEASGDQRIRGDWFNTEPGWAAAIVDAACADVEVERA